MGLGGVVPRTFNYWKLVLSPKIECIVFSISYLSQNLTKTVYSASFWVDWGGLFHPKKQKMWRSTPCTWLPRNMLSVRRRGTKERPIQVWIRRLSPGFLYDENMRWALTSIVLYFYVTTLSNFIKTVPLHRLGSTMGALLPSEKNLEINSFSTTVREYVFRWGKYKDV